MFQKRLFFGNEVPVYSKAPTATLVMVGGPCVTLGDDLGSVTLGSRVILFIVRDDAEVLEVSVLAMGLSG